MNDNALGYKILKYFEHYKAVTLNRLQHSLHGIQNPVNRIKSYFCIKKEDVHDSSSIVLLNRQKAPQTPTYISYILPLFLVIHVPFCSFSSTFRKILHAILVYSHFIQFSFIPSSVSTYIDDQLSLIPCYKIIIVNLL